MQGYEYIFVDEYQDIDEQQYSLVSALAGRRLNDPEAKLSIMAVGDDDQNIYSFKGASVEFIRRFQADYEGTVTYLVENFRSTQNIIAAANHVIQRARRPDEGRPSDPDRHAARCRSARRALGGAGSRAPGEGAPRDGAGRPEPAGAGRVQTRSLAFVAVTPTSQLGDIAVLARTHRSLEPLRALCDIEGLRYEVLSRDGAGAQLPLMQSREGWRHRRPAAGHAGRHWCPIAAIRRWIAPAGQARAAQHLLARHRGGRRRVRRLGCDAKTARCRSAGRAVRGGQRCPAQWACRRR